MRAKLVSIVAILWVAAMGAITVFYVANPAQHFERYGVYQADGTYTGAVISRQFNWSGWLAWSGTITLVALVAIAIIVVVTRKSVTSPVTPR